jgi:peptidoglycan/LPS O-acetylase OafA/YrhL
MPEKKEIPHKSLSYRPDIDGLRAVAVSAVLLFHARLGVPGGFVGVDIFFVLSGFLITSIILKDAASASGFSIVGFWERRIRRILPALFVLILATIAAGWFVLLPSDFADFGKSVFAQAFFAGNFYYWYSAGYFDTPALYKPLLHTWSLAVEEQYYLFFPILFLPWWKLKIGVVRGIIIVGGLVSLALSIVQTHAVPDAAFYLLPSRAWELFLGAFLAVTPYKPSVPRAVSEAASWTGVTAIAIAYGCYSDATPFPGLAAVLPCAGAAAIIWANDLGDRTSSVARLLALRPVVFVGQISYSLYLWHWPILVYAIYWKEYGILSWYIRAALLVLSFVMATLSWAFVETPFRTRKLLARRRGIFAFGLLAPIICASFGAVLVLTHGVPSRFPAAVVAFDSDRDSGKLPFADRSHADILQVVASGNLPRVGAVEQPVRCLLWGDSHANAIVPALAELAGKSSSVELAVYSATGPILNYQSPGKNSMNVDSIEWSQAIVDQVRKQKISNVLLAAHWGIYDDIADKLKATVLALQNAGAKVWIMKDVPYQPDEVPKALARATLQGKSLDIGVSKDEYEKVSQTENEMLAPAAASGATILDPAPYFFTGRKRCMVSTEGSSLYVDHEHLSRRGALLIMDLFQPIWAK